MIKKKLLVSTLMTVSVLLAGCGGGGTAMFRGDISHTGQMSSSGPTSLDTLVWKQNFPDKVYASPVSDGENVYLGCKDGQLYALNQNTGKIQWSFRTGSNVE
ncbi:MAG: PQQ-binding-like beta-propeller repeat protein, partial [Gammaproteobacteria bacterium]|nr:PQQ-binding-like beta-propeller repeat protein [Gammaproteobacteria bacterium]